MDPPDPLIGAVINGKFRIHRAIARGGMGRIYYATQEPFERPVALKVVQADHVNEDESQFLRRFLQEASILAKLQHPNVVMLFDYGRIEPSPVERYFIAMEYLDGETLAQRMKARGVLPTAEVLVLVRQIARGLREAHARGIIHRDLKPSNIVLVPESDGGEIVKLVDFGIGKVMPRGRADAAASEDAQDLTQEGVMVGTPRYMAPEQFDGAASTASDLYALGTITFQMLTGRLPFRGNTLAEFMVAKLAHPVPRLRDVNPAAGVPESLEALVMALLERAPASRPTLEQLMAHLTAVEEEVFGASQSLVRRTVRSGAVAVPLARSGSHPGAAVGAPGPFGAGDAPLKVPLTIVASAPPGALPPGLMGMTPRPMATSTRPPAPGTRSRKGAWIAAGVVAVGLLGAGLLVFFGAPMLGAAAPAPATGPAGPPSALTSTAPSAAPAPEASAFTLHVDSAPSRARVTEGARVLGETPLDIPIDGASVADGPRTFSLKKAGYAVATIEQGPSKADVKTVVSLAPIPKRHVKSRSHGRTKAATGTSKKPTGGGGLDIRLNR